MKRFILALLLIFGLASIAEAQLFPEPVYLVNPNSLASGIMGTSASPMVTTATVTGNVTPSDAYANPTTAVHAYSLGGIFNGTTWDRTRTASSATATTGTGLLGAGILGQYNTVAPTFTNGQFGMIQIDVNGQIKTTGGDTTGVNNADNVAVATGFNRSQSFAYVFDGTTWDRLYGIYAAPSSTFADSLLITTLSAAIRGRYTTSLPSISSGQVGVAVVDNSSVLQTNEAVFSAANITTATTTTVLGTGPGWLKRIIVGVAGAGSTFAVYNIASGGCTGTPASGLQGTYDSSAIRVVDFDLRLANGICVVTTATAPNLTVIYK